MRVAVSDMSLLIYSHIKRMEVEVGDGGSDFDAEVGGEGHNKGTGNGWLTQGVYRGGALGRDGGVSLGGDGGGISAGDGGGAMGDDGAAVAGKGAVGDFNLGACRELGELFAVGKLQFAKSGTVDEDSEIVHFSPGYARKRSIRGPRLPEKVGRRPDGLSDLGNLIAVSFDEHHAPNAVDNLGFQLLAFPYHQTLNRGVGPHFAQIIIG